jgi:MoxR-like ATPase
MDGIMAANDYRERVRRIYRFIEESLYFNRPDVELKGERYNSALLFSMLTALNRGKELIIGEPGLGKTTSAEYVCALLYQFPLGAIWSSEVSGHPEQTEEKIIGRPDLGKLNTGVEYVVWSGFAQLPVKIVDEINRLPETKQSMILDGVDRGNWEYLNKMIVNDEYCLFATANYQDKGTNTIIPPMVDRFDVMVESRHPGPSIAYMISMKKDNILRHPEYEIRLQRVLGSRQPYERRILDVENICDEFGAYLEVTFGLRTIDRTGRRDIRAEMAELEFDMDASAFTRMLLAELSFCYRYGQKRSNESCDEGCHYDGYLCRDVKNCASNRLPISIRNYAQALAWMLGSSSVDVEHVRTVAPYAIAHRVQWKDQYVAQRERSRRDDPLPVYLAKEAVKQVFGRYTEQSDLLKDALALSYRAFNGEDVELIEGDHPIYAEIKKTLGCG